MAHLLWYHWNLDLLVVISIYGDDQISRSNPKLAAAVSEGLTLVRIGVRKNASGKKALWKNAPEKIAPRKITPWEISPSRKLPPGKKPPGKLPTGKLFH